MLLPLLDKGKVVIIFKIRVSTHHELVFDCLEHLSLEEVDIAKKKSVVLILLIASIGVGN